MKAPLARTSYIKNINGLKTLISRCANKDWREEGLACVNGENAEYLTNLIPQDHPDRIGVVRFLTDDETYRGYRRYLL